MTDILRGDIWLFDPEPTMGREIGKKKRPSLVISNDAFNNGPSGLLIVVPLTTKDRKIACHILITPKDGGVKEPCFTMCEQLRSISRERLISKWGHIQKPAILKQVGEWVGSLLSLEGY